MTKDGYQTYFKRRLKKRKMNQRDYMRLTGHRYESINGWANGRVKMSDENAAEASRILGGRASRYREDTLAEQLANERALNRKLLERIRKLESER